MRALCVALDQQLDDVVRQGLEIQPDSRSVGAYVEKAVLDGWARICKQLGVEANDRPGRRTIYDASFSRADDHIGVDIRTKDLDEARYADGGICSVGNLLRLLVRDGGALLVSEFGYREAGQRLEFDRVRTAPIHMLPLEIFRIENLGTGQVRLDGSIVNSYESIDWARPVLDFVRPFAELAIEHYARVSAKADERANALRRYLDGEELALA
jgi:hypothetical protein